jgi:uncharacterized repeat protein (TIGR01451 family)
MSGRAGILFCLGAAIILQTAVAHAEVCLAPGQPFECAGAACPLEAGVEQGQQHEVLPDEQRVRVRAVDSNLSTESSYAELYAAVVEPDVDLFLRANLDVRYSGFLTGFGGVLADNFGFVGIRAIVRDLESNEIVASSLITEGVNEGTAVPLGGGPSAFENLFGPPANRDVPFTSEEGVKLEAGRQYGVGIGVEANARGGAIAPGESDFFTANHGVFLNSLRLITWPDLEVAGFEDDDGDGLPNVWESDGITDCNGAMLLDLPGMGARPDHKDLFVEIDWLEGQEPERIAIQAIKESFAAAPEDAGGVDNPDDVEGISLWLDTGSLTNSDGVLVGDDLGGGNEIAAADVPDPNGEFIPPLWEVGGFLGFEYDVDLNDDGMTDFYQVKRGNFDLIRTRIFRYSISAKARNEDDNKYPGAQAELGGDDTIIFNRYPGTFMHELGHNLGLDHGGDEIMNCKPNHVSVMNYALSFGIPRRDLDEQSQDWDYDGDVDARIFDYSPPRFPGGRGRAVIFSSDEGLNESALDESRPLDPTDQANVTRYFDPDGAGRDLDMDEAPDWNDDGINNASGDTVSVDVNASDEVPGCDIDPQTGLDELTGHDDWSAVQLPIMVDGIVEELADSGGTPVPEVPDPDEETMRAIEGLFNTLDLAVTKSGVPDLVMAGQELTYEITVANAGPNTALEVVVEDTLPELVTPVDLPETCALGDDGLVTCEMAPIAEGESATLALTVQVAPRLPCGRADTVTLENRVSVRNGDWTDVNPRDNTATFQSEALCLRYEYAAKFVCGTQGDQDRLLAAPGRYGTIVNIHNFQSRTVPFFKKLSLGFPPPEQAPGEIHPIGIDELAYDETLKADCDDIAQRLFDGDLPEGFIDGYLVIQSPRRLDVDVFYSAASPEQGGTARSIDIEPVAERDLRADLVIEKSSQVFPVPLGGPDVLSQFRLFAVLYTVRIHNGGAVHAEAIEVSDTVSLALAGAAAATLFVPDEPFEMPSDAERGAIVHEAFPPSAGFTVTLPEIPPGDGAEIRFWALALVYLSNPGDPANRVDLLNRADVSGQGPEVTEMNNRVETLDRLVE